MSKEGTYNYRITGIVCAYIIACIGYRLNGNSIGWAIVDFIFAPFVAIKWIYYQEINITIIKETFPFFFQ
jgi:hypothetical protein